MWPVYYARWLVEWLARPLFKARDESWLDYDLRLAKELRQPPFLDPLRGRR
jgi:hypothetical protein